MADFLNEMRTIAAAQDSTYFDSMAEEFYRGQVTKLVTIMKDQIRTQVEKRDLNQSFHGMQFDAKADFRFPDYSLILPQKCAPKEGSFYKVNKYHDLELEYSYISLKELCELKKESPFLRRRVVWVELTDLGNRFYSDVKAACEAEGIEVYGISVKMISFRGYSPNAEFKLNEKYKCDTFPSNGLLEIKYGITL